MERGLTKEARIRYESLCKEVQYESHGHGSVTLSEMYDENDCVKIGVNWSCCGTIDPEYAQEFANAILDACAAAEKFNRLYCTDEYYRNHGEN